MKKAANAVIAAVTAAVIFGLSLMCFVLPKSDYSETERRQLKSFPPLTLQTLVSGKFMQDFEQYALDSFPFRDVFRSIKAYTSVYGMNKLDNNGIYVEDGYICKQEYPLKPESLQRAVKIFGDIYTKYLDSENTSVYLSVIPDKNYFLADKSGRLSVDYDSLIKTVKDGAAFMQYIDIFPLLQIEDYYETDTHWKQENLTDAAEKLLTGMGGTAGTVYKTNTLDAPFYGVYHSQSALYHTPDSISYLTSDAINAGVVTDYENNKTLGVYDMEKAQGSDPYEMFLSGPLSLITIENPLAETKKELVIFRDSFASSLAPLLLEGYSKITLADIRYISAAAVCEMIDFDSCDVLFLYSTLVLNNSETLKF